MKFTRNVKAISKLLLILLLLMATIIGAILSYLWVIGYFITLESVIPEKTTVSVANVTFNPQDTSYFFVTLLNPSYSPTEANVTEIVASTGKDIHNITEVHPLLPYRLSKSEEETFKCFWNWANYTGETVKIIAFVADGSGPTFETETPLVDLRIIDLGFNSTISVAHFNVTVQNSPSSVTYVNITGATIEREPISAERLSISLPYTLDLNESVSFTCTWDWSNRQDKNVTVAIHTLQGYAAYSTHLTSKPVNLTITNVLFNITDTAHFNVTVNNSADSPTYVNITRITVTMENETIQEITEVNPSLTPSYTLEPSANVTFRCSWNWTNYREKNATIAVYTLQDFKISSTQTTTAQVLLAITEVLFDVADPSHFNITVANSKFSVDDYVNITRATVAVEDATPENITFEPPITLHANASVTLKCVWNWADYWNEEVSIAVHTLQGYSAYSIEVMPSPVIISKVVFNLSDTTRFNVTVENSKFFSTYVLITSVTAALENGIVQDVTVIAPTRLPYVLHPNESVVFVCSWDWTEYCDRDVTVTVNTLQGYVASYTKRTPLPIIIEISDVLFNITDTTHFNVTVRNSEFSLVAANVTGIIVTVENGTALEMTEIAPSLPGLLGSNSSFTFKCSWNWTNYRGKNATIAVYTSQGYTAYYTESTLDPVILIITSISFDTANTTYFNITVRNSEYSIIQVNITRITVTFENETSLEVAVESPPLPYPLPPNDTVLFKCSWNWTNNQGENVIILVETLEGYKASSPYTIPTIT
jgi:hypothetical protein